MCHALGKEWDNISLEPPVSNFNFLHHRQLSYVQHLTVLQGIGISNFNFLQVQVNLQISISFITDNCPTSNIILQTGIVLQGIGISKFSWF